MCSLIFGVKVEEGEVGGRGRKKASYLGLKCVRPPVLSTTQLNRFWTHLHPNLHNLSMIAPPPKTEKKELGEGQGREGAFAGARWIQIGDRLDVTDTGRLGLKVG